MTVQLRAWGNSRGIRVPAGIIKQTGISEEDELEIFEYENDIVISKKNDREAFEKRMKAYAEKLGLLNKLDIDPDVRRRAEEACDELGMPLDAAIYIFMLKLGRDRRFPFEMTTEDDLERRAYMGEKVDYSSLYSKDFFDAIGSGVDDGFDEEPEDFPPTYNPELEAL